MITKYLIFDLDDTLIAFDLVTEKSWIKVCSDYSEKNKNIDPEKFYSYIMKISDRYWKSSKRHQFGRLNLRAARYEVMKTVFKKMGMVHDENVIYRIIDSYQKIRIDNMYIFPEVHDVLGGLKSEGYRLILMTNGDSGGQRAKIKRFDLEKYFDLILIEEEIGFGKPDRRIFEQVLLSSNAFLKNA